VQAHEIPWLFVMDGPPITPHVGRAINALKLLGVMLHYSHWCGREHSPAINQAILKWHSMGCAIGLHCNPAVMARTVGIGLDDAVETHKMRISEVEDQLVAAGSEIAYIYHDGIASPVWGDSGDNLRFDEWLEDVIRAPLHGTAGETEHRNVWGIRDARGFPREDVGADGLPFKPYEKLDPVKQVRDQCASYWPMVDGWVDRQRGGGPFAGGLGGFWRWRVQTGWARDWASGGIAPLNAKRWDVLFALWELYERRMPWVIQCTADQLVGYSNDGDTRDVFQKWLG
jgi:hypothetical protein